MCHGAVSLKRLTALPNYWQQCAVKVNYSLGLLIFIPFMMLTKFSMKPSRTHSTQNAMIIIEGSLTTNNISLE